jgi:predicted phage baseplate assembly protein
VRTDQKGRTSSEVVAIKGLRLVDGYTVVDVDPALTGTFVRASVTVNANVADATHGESTSEILGSGDAATPFQRFALKQPPLTYISAATASGTRSTLTVRVDGVAWTELEWLADAEPTDRVYTVVSAADGRTYVQFGDGVNGARPGSGTNNIVAEYRHGTGKAGLARAGQISTLQSRPLGLKAVTNPTPANGAADPETIDDARTNAPVTVKTLDRIVSLPDVRDFAAASAGITKASASWVWDGARSVACVTVAGTDGAPVMPGSDQFKNLLKAMLDAADGTLVVTLCPYVPVTFIVAATITPDPTLVDTDVLAAVKAALATAFSFGARRFGQPVFASEVIAVVQEVPGVVAVTLDGFARTGDPPSPPNDHVNAAAPTLGGAGLVGAELLTVESGTLPGVVLA